MEGRGTSLGPSSCSIHPSAWRDCLKSPCEHGNEALRASDRGPGEVFMSVLDHRCQYSKSSRAFFRQSQKGYSPKFVGTEFSEVRSTLDLVTLPVTTGRRCCCRVVS